MYLRLKGSVALKDIIDIGRLGLLIRSWAALFPV